jgi:hypothetical protein
MEKTSKYVTFEVFKAVTKRNAVFWDVMRVALIRRDVSGNVSPLSSG